MFINKYRDTRVNWQDKSPLAIIKFSKSLHIFLIVLFVTIRLSIISPLFSSVPGRDSGVFILIGKNIIQGKIPYKDIWDHKGPLIYYINSIGLLLGNGNIWGIWWLEFVVILFSVVCFYFLIDEILSPGSALFGSIVWLIGFNSVVGGNLVEEYGIIVNLAIIYIFQKRRSASMSVFCIGVLAGVGILLRPNEFAYPIAALLLLLLEVFRKRNFAAIGRIITYFMLGIILPIITVSAFFWKNGALSDFFGAVILFNSKYITQGSSVYWALGGGLLYLFSPILIAGFSIYMTFIRGGFNLLNLETQELYLFSVISLALAIPLSILSGRAYSHYYISWLYPIAILAGFIPHYFFQNKSAFFSNSLSYILGIIWSFVIISVFLSLSPILEKMDTIKKLGTLPPQQDPTIIDIDKQVPEKESVLMWGNETSYLLAANREVSGRYAYLTPLLTSGYGENIADEYLAKIKNDKPIILDTSSTDTWIPPLAGTQVKFPWLRTILLYIRKNYEKAGTVGKQNWILWKHI